jgi:anthranilate phosphoribosyltransferase
MKGETAEDITAGASVLRRLAVTIPGLPDAIDIVGTGGDGTGTWNISTAASFVVAGAGVPVAKHGNTSVSSKSGASDVLNALGVNLKANVTQVQKALVEAKICFLMAPLYHSGMRHVGSVRKELAFRSIFNILGPISNPASVKRMMVGVYGHNLLKPFAQALIDLGATNALVVHGRDGMDEATTTTTTDAMLVKDGKITEMKLNPGDIGLPVAKAGDLTGGTPKENAAALTAVLDGNKDAHRDIVVLNAAAAIFGSGHADNLKDGAERAVKSIDSGAARKALDALIRITNEEAE